MIIFYLRVINYFKGDQRSPCIYHIVPAGQPDPPESCAMINATHHSINITCKKGFDGGLRQKFVLVVYAGEELIANLSHSVPEFSITNLEPAQEYNATVYSFNAKGRNQFKI